MQSLAFFWFQLQMTQQYLAEKSFGPAQSPASWAVTRGNAVNANAELRNDGLLSKWRDLTTEPGWKYEELPPFLLSQLTKLDLLQASDSELARAIWFWRRRPKLMFHDSGAPIVVALCIFIFLSIALLKWPGMPMPERVAAMTIVLFEVAVEIYLVIQRIRFVRWRREYEVSIDRVIRTIHPEV
jgi:hypothetical protein